MTLLLCGFVVVERTTRKKRVPENNVTIVGDMKACGQNENPYKHFRFGLACPGLGGFCIVFSNTV
jgi:hypothetical protein